MRKMSKKPCKKITRGASYFVFCTSALKAQLLLYVPPS